MKLKLPLGLLTALFVCLNTAVAQETIPSAPEDGSTGDASSSLVATPDNTYMSTISGDSDSSLAVNAAHVTWNQSHDFPAGTPISVGSILAESTLSVVTPEYAEKETVVTTGANLFIGGWGWGISSSQNLTPLSGKVLVKDATLIVNPVSGANSGNSQLNVGQSGSYAEHNCEGVMEVDHGTVEAGVINVGVSQNSKGTLIVANGGTVTADNRGGSTGDLFVGYYANSTGDVIVKDKSTITVERFTSIGRGQDSSGTMTVEGKSTANLGSDLMVGCYNSGGTGVLTVDDSTLTAGNTILGYADGTSGELRVKGGASATLGQTIVGYEKGSTGKVMVDGASLNTGNTWVGYSGNGELLVDNGGQANASYLYVGDMVTVEDGSSMETVGHLELGKGSMLTVTDGFAPDGTDAVSSLKVGLRLVNNGTVNANLSHGGSVEAMVMQNAGEMNLTLANRASVETAFDVQNTGKMNVNLSDGATYNAAMLNNTGTASVTLADGGAFDVGAVDNSGQFDVIVKDGGSYVADTVTNTGTMDVELESGASLAVTTYKNAGNSTITAAENTTCRIASLELSGGSMKLDGDGSFDLGGETGLSSAFYVSGATESTNIDISAMSGTGSGKVYFSINANSVFTLNFKPEALANIGKGDEQLFTLTLVVGNEDFSVDEQTLLALPDKAVYFFETPYTMTLAASTEAMTYEVTNDEFKMDGNNLIWTGTVKGVPEPTTATLSLLALAALAVRRRRK